MAAQLSNVSAPPLLATTNLSEGAINSFIPEIIQRILFFTDEYESTRLVSHSWNIHSLIACKSLTREDIEIFIGLIARNLDPETAAIGLPACMQVKEALRSLMPRVTTYAQAKRLILITKGGIVGVFKKFAAEKRQQLEQKICGESPTRHRDLFRLITVSLPTTIEGNDFEKFYLIFHSYITFKQEDFQEGLNHAALIGANQMMRVMLIGKRLSNGQAEESITSAVTGNHPSTVQLLLDHVSLTEDSRGFIVKGIAKNSRTLECLQLLLSDGSLPVKHRGKSVVIAASLNKNEFVKSLLAHGPIDDEKRGDAIQAAINNDNLELLQLLQLPSKDGCCLM